MSHVTFYVMFMVFFSFSPAPVIPQTGLPGGAGGAAGKKAAKVPGFVDSTINSCGRRQTESSSEPH